MSTCNSASCLSRNPIDSAEHTLWTKTTTALVVFILPLPVAMEALPYISFSVRFLVLGILIQPMAASWPTTLSRFPSTCCCQALWWEGPLVQIDCFPPSDFCSPNPWLPFRRVCRIGCLIHTLNARKVISDSSVFHCCNIHNFQFLFL
ncbi:hypothetical protein Ddc_08105 [Ditylenchus destructor]|nr:hypothetical protein Ddc_08105 [Ditylenchus destructor]